MRLDWMLDGLCAQVDPELWFPEKGGRDGSIAKRICNGTNGAPPCPVRDTCLQHALDHGEAFGVWGGLSERERRRFRRRAGGAVAA